MLISTASARERMFSCTTSFSTYNLRPHNAYVHFHNTPIFHCHCSGEIISQCTPRTFFVSSGCFFVMAPPVKRGGRKRSALPDSTLAPSVPVDDCSAVGSYVNGGNVNFDVVQTRSPLANIPRSHFHCVHVDKPLRNPVPLGHVLDRP